MQHEHDRRPITGRLGEEIAAWFLFHHGAEILGRNIELAAGEVDILCRADGLRVLVEVRTTTRRAHPDDLFPKPKRQRLRRLAAQARCDRVDLIWVWLSRPGVRIRWVSGLG